MITDKVKITILYDNESNIDGIDSDWGFACLIEAYGRKILFDTGGSGSILLKNSEALGVDLKTVQDVFISHVHFDHIGGLSAFLDVNNEINLLAPSTLRGVFHAEKVVYNDMPTEFYEHFYTSGLMDNIEQSLAIETDKGLVVVVGCSHPGVEQILQVLSQFGKPYALIGGLHGFNNFDAIHKLPYVCPTHCSQYISDIKKIYPDKFIKGGVGKIIEI
ncbi:MAG: MBL fold metallo-hydrolase [Candidatus Zixiibacteriota bacterium]|nr:MAG: MBL fold metallo-hydrolase [candidate division Zixibacteria bacterium]